MAKNVVPALKSSFALQNTAIVLHYRYLSTKQTQFRPGIIFNCALKYSCSRTGLIIKNKLARVLFHTGIISLGYYSLEPKREVYSYFFLARVIV